MWPGVETAGYCPLGAVEEKAQKALLRCIIPLSHMTTYRNFPQPSKSISTPWTHYKPSNTILTIHPSPSPTIYPTFLRSSRGWFKLKQIAITTKRSSCILGQKVQLWHKINFFWSLIQTKTLHLNNFILIFCNKNAHLWQNCTFGNFGQFYTNILEQKCTFVTEMPICNKDALLVIDQIIKSFLSTILQTFFGSFSDNKKMGIISNFKGKLHFWYKWMESLGNFGEILTNSIKIFQFFIIFGKFWQLWWLWQSEIFRDP